MDNLANKGIENDLPAGKLRFSPRGNRKKPWVIESCLRCPAKSVLRQLNLYGWSVWGRYRTETARDQAYAALVKKERNALHWMAHWEYRKKSEDGGGGTGPC